MAPTLITAVHALLALQLAQAHVTGTITDVNGKPIAGALIVLVELDRRALSDPAGNYHFTNLPAGPQHIFVSAFGYAERSVHAFVPRRGALAIDFSLATRPIPLASLEVRPPPAIKGAEGHAMGFGIDTRLSINAVRNHPLLAEPDVLQALHGASVYLRPETPAGVHIRGGGSDQTTFLLDDIPVFNPYHAAGMFGAWNPDAISDIEISAMAPPPGAPDALSGVINAWTRRARSRHSTQGSLSTTQVRATFDGPLGRSGGGYLVSMRSGFPDLFAPRDEPSYLRGETGDWLGKISMPMLGGELSALAYESENEVDAARIANSTSLTEPRNAVAWLSRSIGLSWMRAYGEHAQLRMVGWNARARASALWQQQDMQSSRTDAGLRAEFQTARTRAGVRATRVRTGYQTDSLALDDALVIATLFADRTAQLAETMQLRAGAALTRAASSWRASPRAELRWQASGAMTLRASYARTQQFTQSLRNPESVVSSIFPAELYVVAGGDHRVPIAEADQAVVAGDYTLFSGARITAQLYARRFDDVLLSAPQTGGPFASRRFDRGRGDAFGFAIDGAINSAGYGALASYSWQRLNIRYGASEFVPEHAVSHSLEGGVIAFPSSTWSIKLGATAVIGRRTTPIAGALEWESCNLVDQGCEFGGSPMSDSSALAARALPWYARADLGVRKHWDLHVAGRTAAAAVFGTVTNVIGRRNVFAYTETDGSVTAIGMRPRSVLLAGFDWSW